MVNTFYILKDIINNIKNRKHSRKPEISKENLHEEILECQTCGKEFKASNDNLFKELFGAGGWAECIYYYYKCPHCGSYESIPCSKEDYIDLGKAKFKGFVPPIDWKTFKSERDGMKINIYNLKTNTLLETIDYEKIRKNGFKTHPVSLADELSTMEFNRFTRELYQLEVEITGELNEVEAHTKKEA